MYVCGDYLVNPDSDPSTGKYTGAVAVMSPEGKIQWYMTLGGSNSAGTDQDKCMGIGFNEDTYSVAVLIQGKMAQLRAGNDDYFDTFLMLINSSGQATKAVSITQGKQPFNMYSTPGALFSFNGGRN